MDLMATEFVSERGRGAPIQVVRPEVFAVLTETCTRLPPCPVLPPAIRGAEVILYLLRSLEQAVKWTPFAADAKRLQYVWKAYYRGWGRASLEKTATILMRMRDRAQPTKFSPLLWSWARLMFLHERDIPFHQAVPMVWDPARLERPMLRRIFYDSIDFAMLYTTVLWPEAACDLYARALAGTDYDLDTARAAALVQRETIERAISDGVVRQNLSMWLADDKVKELRLRGVCRNGLLADPSGALAFKKQRTV